MKKKQSRVLRLPGGGGLELPMPDDSVYTPTTPVLSAPSDSASPLVPILIGSALGGGLTWLLFRLSR